MVRLITARFSRNGTICEVQYPTITRSSTFAQRSGSRAMPRRSITNTSRASCDPSRLQNVLKKGDEPLTTDKEQEQLQFHLLLFQKRHELHGRGFTASCSSGSGRNLLESNAHVREAAHKYIHNIGSRTSL